MSIYKRYGDKGFMNKYWKLCNKTHIGFLWYKCHIQIYYNIKGTLIVAENGKCYTLAPQNDS